MTAASGQPPADRPSFIERDADHVVAVPAAVPFLINGLGGNVKVPTALLVRSCLYQTPLYIAPVRRMAASRTATTPHAVHGAD